MRQCTYIGPQEFAQRLRAIGFSHRVFASRNGIASRTVDTWCTVGPVPQYAVRLLQFEQMLAFNQPISDDVPPQYRAKVRKHYEPNRLRKLPKIDPVPDPVPAPAWQQLVARSPNHDAVAAALLRRRPPNIGSPPDEDAPPIARTTTPI